MVLTSDTRSRDSHEPSGEPESLWGKMRGKMGDRVEFSKPEGLEERKEKLKKRREEAEAEVDIEGRQIQRKAKKVREVTVLDVDTFGFYRPKTRQTREAYEALLSMLQRNFGDQPEDVIFGAADEILSILKSDKLQDPEKQRQCERLLGSMSSDAFARFVSIGKCITDFIPESERFNPLLSFSKILFQTSRDG